MYQSNKLHIAVLMGGVSNEREVSLKSGRAVSEGLRSRGHLVSEIDLKERSIEPVLQLAPDVVFIALHGEFGEDGQVQVMLEEAGIPYTGSGPVAAATGMDKKASKMAFSHAGVTVPPHTVVNSAFTRREILQEADGIGFPLVCKPTDGGSSLNVSIVENEKHLSEFFETREGLFGVAGAGGRAEIMLEKYIPGRELTVGILGDEPLPVVEIISSGAFFDYRAKYEDENTVYKVPVVLIESVYRRVCDAALRACRATGCRHMARVDMIYGYDGGVYVLELNTIPGLTPRSLLPMAAGYDGIELPELCECLCLWARAESELKSDAGMPAFQRKTA